MIFDMNDPVAQREHPGPLWFLVVLALVLFLLLLVLLPREVHAQNDGAGQGGGQAQCRFLDHWVQMESRGEHWAANGHSTAVGRWQMTQAAFVDVGLIRQTGPVTEAHYGGREWTNVQFLDNPFGIRSLQDLRANPAAQDYYGRLYHQRQWREAQRQGLVRDFVGRTVDIGGRRVAVNESSLLTCMGYLGAGDCGRMLRGQPMTNPGNVSHALWRMSRASACDGSDLTGQNTPVDAEANIAATADGQYCDPQVLQRLEGLATRQVNAITALAGDPLVGYRTADGRSPLQAGDGDLLRQLGIDMHWPGGTDPFSTRGFSGLSCLDRLFSGINIIFSPPSLPNIIAMLESYVCRQVEQMYARAVAPLNQSFFRDFGVGGISIPVGVGVSVGGPPGIRVNSANVESWGRNSSAWDFLGGGVRMPQDPIGERGGGIFSR